MLLRFVAVIVLLLALSVPSARAEELAPRVYLPMVSAGYDFAGEMTAIVMDGLVWPGPPPALLSGIWVVGANTAEACANLRGDVGEVQATLAALAAADPEWARARALFERLERPLLCRTRGHFPSVYLLGQIPGRSVMGFRAPVVNE